jgi:hypothetical protein
MFAIRSTLAYVLLLAGRRWDRMVSWWHGLRWRITDAAAVACVLVCLLALGSVWALGSRMPAVARQRERWERLWLG